MFHFGRRFWDVSFKLSQSGVCPSLTMSKSISTPNRSRWLWVLKSRARKTGLLVSLSYTWTQSELFIGFSELLLIIGQNENLKIAEPFVEYFFSENILLSEDLDMVIGNSFFNILKKNLMNTLINLSFLIYKFYFVSQLPV